MVTLKDGFADGLESVILELPSEVCFDLGLRLVQALIVTVVSSGLVLGNILSPLVGVFSEVTPVLPLVLGGNFNARYDCGAEPCLGMGYPI